MSSSGSNVDLPKLEDVKQAVKGKNIDRVKELLSSITDDKQLADLLNQKSGIFGRTLVHTAAAESTLEILKYITEHGGIVNCSDEDGYTPLHLSAWEGNLDVVEYLLSEGASLDCEDVHGRTPLHCAAREGKLVVVKYLVSEGASVGSETNYGYTPLHLAAEKGKLDVVEYLVSEGASVDCEDENGGTPLHWAAFGGAVNTTQWLLDNGADINVTNKYGTTSLHIAVFESKPHVVTCLLQNRKCDVDIRNNEGQTAEEIANEGGKPDVRKIIKEHPVRKILFAIDDGDIEAIKTAVANADINGCCQDKTPLLYAVSNGSLDIIKYLCSMEGIDVNRENVSGETPLSKAVELRKGDIINYFCNDPRFDVEHENWGTEESQKEKFQSQIFYPLLARLIAKGCYKVDVNSRNRLGDKVAHMAVKSGLPDGIEFLSKQEDVDFNVRNQDDKTAFDLIFPENIDLIDRDYTSILQIACRTDGKDVVTRRDSKGRTVLHLAVLNKDEKAFSKLHEMHKADIDVNAADKEGNTTLSSAVENETKLDSVALIILSDPRLKALTHCKLAKDEFHILKEIVQNRSTENDEFGSILEMYLSETTVPRDSLKNTPYTLAKLFEKADDKTSVLDEFRKKIDDETCPHNVKKIYTALLNITLIGLQKYADHKNLQYVLYKGSVFKTFVDIFVELSDEQLDDSDYLVQLLRVLYISTQANIKCDCGSTKNQSVGSSKITKDTENDQDQQDIEDNYTQSVLENTRANINFDSDQSHSPHDRNTDTKGESKTKILSRSLAKTLGEDLHRKFKVQIEKISDENNDKKINNAQLIASCIQNAYFKDESGFCDSFEKAITKASEKLSECLHLRTFFHKCVCRGDFTFILCFSSIFFQSSDIVSDAMVGFKTRNGFSERLGIFMIALVLVTLVHENIRSVVSAYETDQDLLRITLGRKDLTDKDFEKSELNYYKKCSNPILRSVKQFFWTFKVCDESGNFTKNSVKPLTFNLLSLLMLRPVVDRLIVISHSPSHLRAIYRQQAKQKSLNQYYMILEQMPELLIQFYVFQIYFNNLRTTKDIENYGCTEHHSFTYRTGYFECVENLWRLKICALWWEIYSMLVPFFKIPNSMVSLEKIFRILSPESPKMSAAASVFLYIAYILMIPSRLFLFAAMMHSAPDHFYVVAYLGFITLVCLIFKLCARIRRKKDLVDKKAHEDETEKKRTAELYIKTIRSLLLFTVRDVVVISLRSADAYLFPSSEVNYKTLRSWKKMLVISSYYFVEGVVGAVFVEHYYPCGRNTEIFKYQGWLYLITLVISVTIITLLSYILQPTNINIIPRRFPNRAVTICSLGLLMWTVGALTFLLTTKTSTTDVRLPLIITTLIILLVFLAVVVILRYFSEAKVKKSKDKDAATKETSKDKSCCSPKFRRFLCCGGKFKCLCCCSDEGTTAAVTIHYTTLEQEDNLEIKNETPADHVTKEQSFCLPRISNCFCCSSNRNSKGDKTCETVGENIGMSQLPSASSEDTDTRDSKQEQAGTSNYKQEQAGTINYKQEQAGTSNYKQEQAGTSNYMQEQAGTSNYEQEQAGTSNYKQEVSLYIQADPETAENNV